MNAEIVLYIDPSSLSLVLAAVLGSGVGALMYVRTKWQIIKNKFS
jgi:hypothetical protein